MKSITQKLDYGCGVACFAFVCNMSFDEAVTFLGKEYSVKHGWRPSDLVAALNRFGLDYKNYYVRKKDSVEYPEGSIVLIERSRTYPVGHYLVLTSEGGMDPWINLPYKKEISQAESGFRKQLPGRPMYAILPIYF
jgi:ABC-type bacteriocin/lantibiotic exporter with double-glycine peptidase domain